MDILLKRIEELQKKFMEIEQSKREKNILFMRKYRFK